MSSEPKNKSFKALGSAGFYEVAYLEWGDNRNPEVLVCVHGFSRNSHDFDFLARELQDQYRVICPDIVGRGNSTYTQNPATYNFQQYTLDMVALIARLDVSEVSWLGSSMGGVIGMSLAAQANTPIKKLIMNDVGMFIPKESVIRIREYASKFPAFENLQEARKDLELRLSTWGKLTEKVWLHMLNNSFKKSPDGKLRYAYDETINTSMAQGAAEDTNLDFIWKGIKCPTLIIRGTESDLLLKKTVEEMLAIHKGASAVEIPGVGHIPSLMTEEQIKLIKDWLKN